jgi:hypothetical protein
MGRIVIAAYKPKPGLATELETVVKTHAPLLRSQFSESDQLFAEFAPMVST